VAAEGDPRVDRPDQHDAPAVAAGDHRPPGGAGAPERAVEVDIDHPAPGAVGELVGGTGKLDPGARHEHVDTAEGGDDALDQRVARGTVGDVDAQRRRRCADGRTRSGRRRLVDVGADDGVAALAKRQGDGLADAGTRSGDDGNRHVDEEITTWSRC
jgi:hypothetical protein